MNPEFDDPPFERAKVLNKVLGDYIENLDRNQLKIGIWGGEFQFQIPWEVRPYYASLSRTSIILM